jgi:two-component SAPR family response regulator
MTYATALVGVRVLLVEDEMIVSVLLEDILADAQCVIVGPFARLPEALASARNDALDLAVLDVNLAGVKVYPVAEVLAERGIPFMLLSGYGQTAVPSDHPDWQVCSKPIRPERLVSILEKLVRQSPRS